MQLQGLISFIYVMQTEIGIFKAELASHDSLWLSQSITASIAVVEELSCEDAANLKRVSPPGRPREPSSCWSLLPKSLLRSPRPPLALVA